MSYVTVIKKQYNATLQTLIDDYKSSKDKEFFRPTGTQIYDGRQGSGKTISAVKHAIDIKRKYPKSIIVSNLSLKWLNAHVLQLNSQQQAEVAEMPSLSGAASAKQHLIANLHSILKTFDAKTSYIQFSSMEELSVVLTEVNNDFKGVLYIVDEIHTYLNALDSKNIPMFIFTEISQQRKQRKAIIGTSQLFMRVAKPIREQCDNIIRCRTIMGIITIQRAYDGSTLDIDYSGHLIGTKKRTGWFFQTRELRNSYDTYQKVVSSAEQYDDMTMSVNLSDRKNKKLLKSMMK